MIALSGSQATERCRQADVALDVAVEREADPLNLAPTASATAAMALGDALATALMILRRFRAEDLIVNHSVGPWETSFPGTTPHPARLQMVRDARPQAGSQPSSFRSHLTVRAAATTGIRISFFTENGLYGDPCRWDVLGTGDTESPATWRSVRPSTIWWLRCAPARSTRQRHRRRSPSAATPGRSWSSSLPDNSFTRCDNDDLTDPGGHAFVFSGPGLYAQGPAISWHLYILDVEGTRLIAVILSYAGTPRADLDLARSIIETMDINP